jgi:hypothetical protein
VELAWLDFAKSGYHTDRLHRGEATHEANHRAEDADFGAVIAVIRVVCITNKTAVAGLIRLPPAKRADLTVELADRRRNQRHPRGNTQVIDDQPCRKIIAPIDHNINAIEQCRGGLAGHPLAQRFHFNIRIKLADDPFDYVDLGRTNISIGVEYLPLKIGTADDIIIDHAQTTNASGGKILDRRAANPARADNQEMRIQQANLPCPANLLQDDMAGIAIKLFIAKFS